MSEENVVKWLYPGATTETNRQGMENSSPTNSGPDSEAAYSVDELPSETPGYQQAIPEDLSNKVAAATSYVGSFFNPSAWKNPSGERSPSEPEEDSASSSISSSLFSAIGKVPVPGFSKLSPTSEETLKEDEAESGDAEKIEDPAGTGGFFSAFSKIGISGMSSSASQENFAAGKSPSDEKETWGTSLSHAFTKVGKVATDYSKVVQETVYKAPMIADFNKEQEEFIKSKNKEHPSAPWAGYQNEEELKKKILSLSEDKRNVLRSPPTGVNFDFEYCTVASPALLLLEADPKLKQLRYELVPKVIKEDEFWRNYFYRVSLIKQSFELSNSMTEDHKREKQVSGKQNQVQEDNSIEASQVTGDHDDEFVSDLHQASSKDIAEADEAMKKLGLTKNDSEWEAELEGELNEYEMVDDDGEAVDVEDNPEWENQIQEMLEAETTKKS